MQYVQITYIRGSEEFHRKYCLGEQNCSCNFCRSGEKIWGERQGQKEDIYFLKLFILLVNGPLSKPSRIYVEPIVNLTEGN